MRGGLAVVRTTAAAHMAAAHMVADHIVVGRATADHVVAGRIPGWTCSRNHYQ